MHIPEATPLLCEPVICKPCKLVITNIIKTGYSPAQVIFYIVILEKFYKNHTIEKKIVISICGINTEISFRGFLLFFSFFVTCGCGFFIAVTRNYYSTNDERGQYFFYHKFNISKSCALPLKYYFSKKFGGNIYRNLIYKNCK